LAVAGVAAVVVLAVGSLGERFLSRPGGSAVDAAQDAANGPDTIPVFIDEKGDPGAEAFAVHVASYRDAASARKLAGELRVSLGAPTHVTATELDTGLWYRVLVGDFTSRDEARELMLDLGERDEFAFVRTVRLVRPDATPEVSS
jgi:cell division septation protein DedD